MDQDIFSPPIFFGHFYVEFFFKVILAFTDNHDMFGPTNFSNQWLEF